MAAPLLSPNHPLFHHVAVGAAPSVAAVFAVVREILGLERSIDVATVAPILGSHLKFSAAQAQL